MKNLKKIVSTVLIAAILIATVAFIPANAATYNKAALVSYLTKQFQSRSEEIDISSYKIPENRYEEIYDLIETEIPTIFCTSEYKIYSQSNICAFIKAKYISKAKYEASLKEFNENTEYLLRGLKTSKLSDEDKILLVHDRIAAWCEYDYTNYDRGTITKTDRRAFGVIVNKTAVCAGYARAFNFLIEKLGISSEYVSSEKLNHAWNIVTLNNGKRYHVDVTWDDTRCVGEVEHDNLLRSTKGIVSTNHNASDFDSSPKDTTYDSYYWQKSEAEIQYFNGALYYVDKTNGNIVKRTNGAEKTVTCVDARWVNSETGGRYIYCLSKLCSDDSYVYFTTPDSVCSIDARGNVEKVWSPDLPNGYGIYGFSLSDGYLNIYCYKTADVKAGARSCIKLTHSCNTVSAQESTESIESEEPGFSTGFDFFGLLSLIIQRIEMFFLLILGQ